MQIAGDGRHGDQDGNFMKKKSVFGQNLKKQKNGKIFLLQRKKKPIGNLYLIKCIIIKMIVGHIPGH